MNECIIEIVEEKNNSTPVGTITYLSHREVPPEDKRSTKVRIVYDASTKEPNGLILNDYLYKGPRYVKTQTSHCGSIVNP